MTPLFLTTQYFRTYVYEIQKGYRETRCCITGAKDNLTVHHTTAYKELLLQAFEAAGVPYSKYIADVSQEQISLIIDQLIRLHKETKLYTVAKHLHKRYHDNYEEVNIETWEHFVAYQKKRRRIAYSVRSKNKAKRR